MPSVGTAYVNVRINTKSFETGLDRLMARLSTKMEAAGTKLGKDFDRGLAKASPEKTFEKWANSAEGATNKIKDSFQSTGDKGLGMGQRLATASEGSVQSIKEIGDEADSTSKKLGGLSQSSSNASRSLSRMGGGGGGRGLRDAGNDAGFFSGKLRELIDEAPKGTATLNHLFQMEAFGGTALAGAIGGLSGIAQGVFAIGANAASAVPAVAVFTNGLLGLAQVGGTIAISMKGVGEALKAGFDSTAKAATAAAPQTKALDAATKSALNSAKAATDAARRAVEAAQRGVRDALQGIADAARGVQRAKQDLQNAYRDAARAAEDAARRTSAAERDLAAAQRDSAIAQKDLNLARGEALKQMQDIAFAAEDASLAEDRAALALADAHQQLLAVSELAPDDRARVEAELAFKEAELNMREAKARRIEADADQRKSARTGVEGTQAMQSARDNLAQANDREASAQQDVNDARREEGQVAEDNARKIQDAQQGVADAQRGMADAQQTLADAQQRLAEAQQKLTDAQKKQNDAVGKASPAATAAASALDKYNAALAKLSPNQRKFVELIIAQQGRFKSLRNQIADPLFGKLITSFEILNQKGKDNKDIFQTVADGLTGTGKVLGDVAIKASTLASTDIFQARLGRIMNANNGSARIFGDAGIQLADAFTKVADAAGPLLRRFALFVRRSAFAINNSKLLSNTARGTTERFGNMEEMLNRAGDRISEFWGLAKQLGRTLFILGSAANTAANSFGKINDKTGKSKGYIPTLTEDLTKFNNKLEKNPGLVDRFTNSLTNLSAAGGAIKTIGQPFIDMGSDPRIATAFDTIAKSPAFGKLGKNAGDAVPKLADLIVKLLDIVATLSETGSIDHFLSILDKVAGAVAVVVGYLGRTRVFGKSILAWVAYATAAAAAIRILWKAVKIGSGPLIGVGKSFGRISDFVNKQPRETNRFKEAWSRAWASVSRTAKNTITTMQNAGTRIANIFRPKASKKDLRSKIAAPEKVDSGNTKAAAAGKSVSQAFSDGFKSGLPLVDAAIAALELKVTTSFTEISTSMATKARGTGLNIMRGLAQGIEAGIPVVTGAVGAATGKIISAINKGAGTMSPSVKTMKTGQGLVQGITVGMEEALIPATAAANATGAKIGTSLSTGAAVGTAGLETSMGVAAATVSTELAVVDTALVGTQVAMESTGVVARISSLGVRAFGAAMNTMGGPLGIIMLLLPILLPIIMKLNDKFHLTEKVMDAVSWSLDKIGAAFSWLWDKMKELFEWVKKHWPLLLAIITGPIGLAIYAVIKNWDKLLAFVKGIPTKIGRFLRGMWNVITSGLSKVWTRVQQIWGRITTWVKGRPGQFVRNLKALWSIFQTGLSTAYRKVIQIWGRITTWIKGRPAQFVRNMKALWNVFRDRLSAMWTAVQNIWSRITTWAKNRPAQFTRNLKALWDQFKDGLSAAWTWVQNKWTTIKNAIAKWKNEIAGSLKHIFDGIGKGLVTAINWVGGKIRWMIDKLNDILDKFNAPNITVSWTPLRWTGFPGLAEGGPVHGPGGPKGDKVIRRLSDNEHVWTAREVAAAGGHRNVALLRKATLRGGGLGTGGGNESDGGGGGIIGWIKDKVGNLGDALKKGYEFAFKWVLSKFKDTIGTTNTIPKKMILGMFEWAATKITGVGKREDEAAAAAAAASSSGSGPAAIWRALRSVGYSKVQTAGVMGNMQSESGFDPFIVQGGGHSLNPAAAGGGGYGLVQWTPGRKLIPYLKGKKPSINTEITALAAQLAGRGSSPERAAGRRLKAATTVPEAARAFELGYERHAGGPQPRRVSQALAWYKRFKGSDAMAAAMGPVYTGPSGGWTYPLGHRYGITQYPNRGHNPSWAVDIGAPTHTSVRAASSGIVRKSYDLGNRSYGKYIEIEHARGIRTLYAHLERRFVRNNQHVRTGQQIGWSNSTGHSTGPHLHFELKPSRSTVAAMAARGVRLGQGGVVSPSAMGTMAILAEAGQHERVTPLDREGFTPAERRMLEALENSLGGNGGGDSYHVHPAPGMNETALADKVARRVAWNRRRGAGWR